MNKFYKLLKVGGFLCIGLVTQFLFIGWSLAAVPEPDKAGIQARLDVSGKVVSSTDGLGIPGVSILVKGTYTGTVTDVEGNYKISLTDDMAVLVFSSIGYLSQEVEVNGRSIINITLEEDVQSLQEVVVVGYGEQKKENLTGSVSTVNTEELRVAPMPSITQSLAGRASGLYVKNGNAQPGQNKTSYNIRGFGDALIIIDGYPASENDFTQLDPHDIENISILKDAASAAVYGARAGNGVILVTTRRGLVSDTKITYSGNYGLQYFSVVPDFVSSENYARMENMSRYNEGLAPVWTNEDIQKFADGSDPERYPNVDWWNRTLRKYAPQVQHNINVQGGT
ncbi:MAG TPA: TonB-dependent receptor plug domain-containing protein, partial [Cyclobacteriaceae bacterium]|nr:TonB-dependent receptor plug domain-containing protein [Cyclobacteriaceae bacterium]